MTLENSANFIYCQECANKWMIDDATGRYYFESDTSFDIGDYASPQQIASAGERMTFCPKCDTRQLEALDEAMDEGDERDPDIGDTDPGAGDADSVHQP